MQNELKIQPNQKIHITSIPFHTFKQFLPINKKREAETSLFILYLFKLMTYPRYFIRIFA